MLKILIDTSVWIECREDKELMDIIKNLAGKHEIRSSEIIDKEIERASEFLRKKKIQNTINLKNFYFNLKKATIHETMSIKELVDEYEKEADKLQMTIKKIRPDFTIVASASIDSVDFILSLNRKTMASDFARAVYTLVNQRKKLKVPKFLTDKGAIRRLSYV